MPASITLTVSHLPTSTSFFLSALQPLDYAYRGRAGQTIGFGSASDKSAPADFWITQEIPGVPAGAAHVAFPAPSRAAVQDFFVAALKAGGKIHGEPCVRDASGYYSGAVIDFDGNSIEAVHRPTFSDDKENDVKTTVSRRSSVKSVKAPSTAARSVASRAPSARSEAPPPTPPVPSGDVIDNLMAEARSAADVARNIVNQVRQNNSPPSQAKDTSGAVVGTLLGVAAGAALHYAFTNNQNRPAAAERSVTEPVPQYEYSAYSPSRQSRAIEGAPSGYGQRLITMHDNTAPSEYASTVRPRRSSSVGARSTTSRRPSTRMIEAPPTSYKAPTVLTNTTSHRDDRSRASSASHRSRRRSQSSDRTIVRVTETIMSAARHPLPASTRSSRAPSPSKANSRAGSKASSPKTATREPADYPLPPSRASTWTSAPPSRKGSKSSGRTHSSSDSKSVVSKTTDLKKLDLPKGELTPDDSISQISVARTEKSGKSRKSRR